jgi:hypothetical protein
MSQPTTQTRLFDVLPSDLFRPLASANREHYWQLLTLLYGKFFGPEADLPPAQGWDRRLLVIQIESLIENDDPWEPEGDADPSTPLNVRANTYLTYLTHSGWFLEERVGLARVLSMPPAVTRFLGDIFQFIEFSPGAVGAKMRSIEGALSKVLDPGHSSPGDDLDLAANQARELVTAMSAIGLRVRNVMRELTAQVTTAEAMRKIFEDYIGKLYMTDYAELAGADHPLARKAHVLELARDIAFTGQRDRLATWYAEHRFNRDAIAAEAHLDRTLKRVLDLTRLQDYLDRLEGDIRRMHHRMLALIDYRLHAPSHLEVRIKRAIAGVKAADDFDVGVPAGPGQLLSGPGLYEPRLKRSPIPRETDRLRRMSPRGEALMRLQKRARSARIVMSADVRAYLHHSMGQRRQIAASELPIGSIKEFRIVQTLATYAQEANTRLARKHGAGESKKLPDYKFAPTPDEWVKNGHFEMPNFLITRMK